MSKITCPVCGYQEAVIYQLNNRQIEDLAIRCTTCGYSASGEDHVRQAVSAADPSAVFEMSISGTAPMVRVQEKVLPELIKRLEIVKQELNLEGYVISISNPNSADCPICQERKFKVSGQSLVCQKDHYRVYSDRYFPLCLPGHHVREAMEDVFLVSTPHKVSAKAGFFRLILLGPSYIQRKIPTAYVKLGSVSESHNSGKVSLVVWKHQDAEPGDYESLLIALKTLDENCFRVIEKKE